MKTFLFVIAVLGIIAINIIALVILRNVLDIVNSIASHRGCSSASFESIQNAVKELRIENISGHDALTNLAKSVATDLKGKSDNIADNCKSIAQSMERHKDNSTAFHQKTHELLNDAIGVLKQYTEVLGEQKKNLEEYKAVKAAEQKREQEELERTKARYLHIKAQVDAGVPKSAIRKEYLVEGRPCRVSEIDKLLALGESMGWSKEEDPAPDQNESANAEDEAPADDDACDGMQA